MYDVEENIEEKRCRLTRETEAVCRGSFEDKELVNVVQNLVISKYVFLSARNLYCDTISLVASGFLFT